MRIDEFQLGDKTFQVNRFLGVEFRGERVMCQRWHVKHRQGNGGSQSYGRVCQPAFDSQFSYSISLARQLP
jgi:hypothetical protein